ncbi:Cyclopropane-fatty-acyl-phospholipid synthase [hydrothermal vent metagenome]|uniref:Cyclopropane-fatty-acyl-phospholipid synthase n=1 Tax=hydrothermal vent metagenome TaxID=652676 RepID=A0A3B0YHX7_9ZZZZ
MDMRTENLTLKLVPDTSAVVPVDLSVYPERVSGAGRRVLQGLMKNYSGPVAVRLWNGEVVIGSSGAPCTVVFNHPQALRDLILHRDLVRLAEDYQSGAIDVEGDMESLFSLTDFMLNAGWSLKQRLTAFWNAWRLPSGHAQDSSHEMRAGRGARQNSKRSIAHHYDVSNDFYRLWLDPEMVYSCAYFEDGRQTLAGAQQDKLDYICRKLRLEPGQTLLDIGCGWGALVLWAARHYGVKAHGITLSEEQYRYAQQRIRDEGLEDQVTVELRDYRDLPDQAQYDRVVSVGMFEHIGLKNFDTYFSTVRRVLKKGGLFLNHGITNDSGWGKTPVRRFVNRYIFPDGELARISDVNDAMEKAGFELLDVESLRRHYAMTLRRWVKSLEAHKDQAVRAAGDKIYRLWRLYMAGSAYYFEQGSINVYQVLVGHVGNSLPLPLRRDDLCPIQAHDTALLKGR